MKEPLKDELEEIEEAFEKHYRDVEAGYGLDSSGVKFATDPRKRWVSGDVVFDDDSRIPYRMPVISQITETLWMGGVEPGLVLPDFIENVVNLSPFGGYVVEHQIQSKLAYRMDDSNTQDLSDVYSLSNWVACRPGPTLVHCHMGLNRSGVVTAGALMWSGWSANAAINTIRAQRSPAALCNSHFVDFLKRSFWNDR